MRFLIGLFQALHTDMGVHLRSAQGRVAEHLADGLEVSAVVEKVCGKGVTQDVRTLSLRFC